MSVYNLEALIEDVKTQYGSVIAKPKMTEKLLAKPPFRFLHDAITAVCKETSFAEGLYDESELDSAAITDKNAKIAYLDKIFNLVGICNVSVAIHHLIMTSIVLLYCYCHYLSSGCRPGREGNKNCSRS